MSTNHNSTSQFKVDPELYSYVIKGLDVLDHAKWITSPDELNRRATWWLDFYERHAGVPLNQVQLKISDFLKENNLPQRYQSLFGRLLKGFYQDAHSSLPPTDGAGTYRYTHADRDLFCKTLTEMRAICSEGENK